MTPLEWAAIIGATSTAFLTLVGLFGGAIRYIVSMILDAYKAQSAATIEAKNQDISAKERMIEKLERRVETLDHCVNEHEATIRDLRRHLLALGEAV